MKRRVIFYIGWLVGGGAERVLIDILRSFDYSKYEVSLGLLWDGGVLRDQVPPQVNVITMIDPKRFFLRKFWWRLMFKRFPSLFHRLKIKAHHDVEVAFLEDATTRLVAHSADPRSLKVAWVHTDMQSNNWALRFYESKQEQAWCYSRFDRVLCVSEAVRDAFCRTFSRTQGVLFQQNVINTERIVRLAGELGHGVRRPEGLLIVAIGRIEPQKGFDRLVAVHAQLLREGLAHTIWVVGDGPARSELEAEIESKGVRNTFQLIGFSKNPYVFLKQADFLVCPSRTEGMSTVVAEAFVLGVPVVTTDCSGARELTEDGRYGVLVANTEDGLAQGVRSLLTSSEARERYRRLSVERGEHYSVAKTMQDIYQKLLPDKAHEDQHCHSRL